MVYGYIYKIINMCNEKVYVGQTTRNIELRLQGHFQASRKLKNKSYYFYNAIRKYGEMNFRIEKICECFSLEELNNQEIYYIQQYQSYKKDYGYNIRLGGGSGGKWNEEAKQNRSNSRKGMKGHPAWNKGITYTQKPENRNGAMKGKFGKDNYLSKPVKMFDLNNCFLMEFAGVREAARTLKEKGILKAHHRNISRAALKQYTAAYGYKWEYV
jgi:group I intron endonuclease